MRTLLLPYFYHCILRWQMYDNNGEWAILGENPGFDLLSSDRTIVSIHHGRSRLAGNVAMWLNLRQTAKKYRTKVHTVGEYDYDAHCSIAIVWDFCQLWGFLYSKACLLALVTLVCSIITLLLEYPPWYGLYCGFPKEGDWDWKVMMLDKAESSIWWLNSNCHNTWMKKIAR